MMFRIRLIKINIILSVVILVSGCSPKSSKPNVIFFLVDDLGWSDVGCYGSKYYETPNIDKLASDGMLFMNAYAASSVCSPTRASILTGKYPARLHITHAIPLDGSARLNFKTPLLDADYVKNLPLEEVTIAEALKDTGYTTAMIGKWHVCWDTAYYPEYQGFDINIGGNNMGNPGDYFYPYHGKWRVSENYPWIEWNTIKGGHPGEYLTDRLTEEAEKFIRQKKDQPFFLYLSHYAVHQPIQARDSLVQKYQHKEKDLLKGHVDPVYAAMIESVDQSLGRIENILKELKLTDNTIIFFISDNGGYGYVTSNYPLRGNKANFYEGGIRVPLIVKWPRHIAPGTVNNTPVISTDFYPTILGLLDLSQKPEQHVDGINLALLLTQGGTITRNNDLYWHFPNYIGGHHPDPSKPCSVILSDDMKMIEWLENGICELYNLRDDVTEQNDLSEIMPEKVDQLRAKLNKWRNEVNAQMPRVNPDYKE
jgi:arylsulfatase A